MRKTRCYKCDSDFEKYVFLSWKGEKEGEFSYNILETKKALEQEDNEKYFLFCSLECLEKEVAPNKKPLIEKCENCHYHWENWEGTEGGCRLEERYEWFRRFIKGDVDYEFCCSIPMPLLDLAYTLNFNKGGNTL
ncbi:MAG: hypothetical protein ACRCZB_04900 [Bacteroidales bacterium]